MTLEKFDFEKLKPWNWFKHEGNQSQPQQVPVTRKEAQSLPSSYGNDPFLKLHNEIDQLFDRVFNQFGLGSSLRNLSELASASFPSLIGDQSLSRLDISTDNKSYEITVDVPGFNEDNLSIDVQNDILRISGKRENETKQDDKHYYRVERSAGTFQRTLSLPDDADANEINASLKDGVLTLTVPRKAIPHQETKRIAIQSR